MKDELRPFPPGQETSAEYRAALGRFATGVTVVTCLSEHGPLGITANSFASVSLDPPLVLWSPARASARFRAFEMADRYMIHVLAEDQEEVCHLFALEGFGFDGVDWRPGTEGVPVIAGCLALFECVRHAVYDGGDHAIVVGRVITAAARQGAPLIFSSGCYGSFAPGGPAEGGD